MMKQKPESPGKSSEKIVKDIRRATGKRCSSEEPHPAGKLLFPGDLEASIEAFVDHYNHHCYHESINNLTPADVYFRRGQTIREQRERIKRKTIQTRCLHHRQVAA
jgi:transposase InsO family protein